jgi:hypothetical protein
MGGACRVVQAGHGIDRGHGFEVGSEELRNLGYNENAFVQHYEIEL